jgi:hypothetical protein
MATGTPTPQVRVGLVAYRDLGDEYVTRTFPLSHDLDSVYKHLRGFQAIGGGDSPEAVQDGLSDAVNKMQWSDARRVAKMIFLVGDAPAHAHDQSRLLTAAKQAIGKGIVVNTIRCGADPVTGAQFTQVAHLADGRFDSIDQSGGVVAIATPFDGELAKLNGELMDTALYAGRAPTKAAAEARREEAKAMAAPAAADRISYMSKSGGGAVASGAGAVGAVDLAEKPEMAAKMSKEELPEPMQKMSDDARVSYAKDQQQKRKVLEGKIAELSTKRDSYVSDKAGAKADSFDERVFGSVKAAAKKADVTY